MTCRPIRNVRAERVAYQIWGLLQRTGGDCTLEDMAQVTGESWQRCRAVCEAHGWGGLYRITSEERHSAWGTADLRLMMDRALSDLEGVA